DERLDVPLVVCVGKYDVWRTLLPHVRTTSGSSGAASLIDHTSIQFLPQIGIAGLDVEEINMISLLVRSFVNDLCPEFVAMAEAQFKVVRYFPVSALGTSPEYDNDAANGGASGSEMLKVRPIDLQPFRVTHPLLWLMTRWQLIRRLRARTDAAQKNPHAQLQGLTEERMRLVTPRGSILNLDRDYACGSIVDPNSGDMVWIPPLPQTPAQAPSQAPAPAAPKNDAAPLKLTMNEPPRPKRGWFKK